MIFIYSLFVYLIILLFFFYFTILFLFKLQHESSVIIIDILYYCILLIIIKFYDFVFYKFKYLLQLFIPNLRKSKKNIINKNLLLKIPIYAMFIYYIYL
ncbi:hypothetical protein RclHR1_06500015 [Rhizophagus clarus]|uniref:Uncharacterized protein n=1 Tax=Rhizophagus clarus TaxID=94130 RepID=A0A2Z6RYC7_9GLOM|nr:hypothetical protein RclHR1_06500015 [Rhizophagus clarus]